MIRPILQVPDPRLTAISDPGVAEMMHPDMLQELIRDLFDTCAAHNGAGLAAPQIGVLARVFVIDCAGTRLAFVNPEILKTSAAQTLGPEGCLSIPDKTVNVWRYDRIVVADRGHKLKFRGFAARAIQHELDHLDGVLITDHENLREKTARLKKGQE